jgi:hypothetical protein
MKKYTDKEIQNIFKTTSSSFSPSREHFRKIVASLDMETAHSTPKILIKRSSISPYAFFHSRFVQVAGSAFVFMFALLGLYSSSNAPTQNSSGTVAQNVGGETSDTSKSVAVNTSLPSSSPDGTNNTSVATVSGIAMAKRSQTVEAAAITSAVSTELSAEQDANGDLFALSGI